MQSHEAILRTRAALVTLLADNKPRATHMRALQGDVPLRPERRVLRLERDRLVPERVRHGIKEFLILPVQLADDAVVEGLLFARDEEVERPSGEARHLVLVPLEGRVLSIAQSRL